MFGAYNLRADRGAFGGEINGGESDAVALDLNCLVDRLTDGGVQQQALGAVGQRVATIGLRPEIGVDLIEEAAAQRGLSSPGGSNDPPGELCVDHDAPPLHQIVEHDIGPHAWQDVSGAVGAPVERPVEWTACEHGMASLRGVIRRLCPICCVDRWERRISVTGPSVISLQVTSTKEVFQKFPRVFASATPDSISERIPKLIPSPILIDLIRRDRSFPIAIRSVG